MITEVDKYRGFDISFDTEDERFIAYSTNHDVEVTKTSYAAIKKHVDEFLKDNANFRPFYVVTTPGDYVYSKKGKIKIIGIRKDNLFVAEDEDGKKFQVSKYDEERYIESNSEVDKVAKEYARLDKLADEARDKARNYLETNLNIKTLKTIKKEITNTASDEEDD